MVTILGDILTIAILNKDKEEVKDWGRLLDVIRPDYIIVVLGKLHQRKRKSFSPVLI